MDQVDILQRRVREWAPTLVAEHLQSRPHIASRTECGEVRVSRAAMVASGPE